ncbi:MAG: hypothetical protein MUE73_16275 [Planctomycetes bacterium]|nr:hypothetical protein [Planctomycetota bacterium]
MGSEIDAILLRQSARKRHLVYLVCAVVVAGCAGGFVLLSRGGGTGAPATASTVRPPPPTPAPPAPRPVPEPVAPPETVVVPAGPRPADRPAEILEADRRFEQGMAKLRAAMQATPGEAATIDLFREALGHLIAAQGIYEKYVEANPAEEDRLGDRLTDLAQQLYWCRKTLPATAFPSTDDTPGGPGERAGASTPPRPTERPPAPPPAIPVPAFRPQEVRARFDAAVRQGFASGRPDLVLEAGLPILEDARMEEHREGVAEAVDLARGMAGFLAAARRGLIERLGRDGEVALRSGPVRGVLVEEAGRLLVRGPGDETPFQMSDLSASALAALAEAAGGLAGAADRRTAGAYLLLRGDREEGARLLLEARAGGADPGALGEKLSEVLARSPALRALDTWLRLEPMLRTPGPELLDAVDQFMAEHQASEYFRANRERIFAAYAKAVGKTAFDVDSLFVGLRKLTGKSVDLRYDFELADQLLDFVVRGEFKVEGGALLGQGGFATLERFDLTNADLRFVLGEVCEAAVGFSSAGGRGRVVFTMKPLADGVEVALRRDDRPFALEKLPKLSGEVEVVLQKRDDKYQARVKGALALKGTDGARNAEPLTSVFVACVSGPLSLAEMELKTDLDLEWARGGGRRFATWIHTWWVAGAFPLARADNLKLGLAEAQWPEKEPFAPEATGDDGKPRWTPVRAPDGPLDLNRYLKPNERCVGYAAVRVWSPEKRAAILELECDDDACAWLNGTLVLREAPIGQSFRAPLKIEKGDNLLLVKVVESWGGWWVRARILGKSGETLRDLLCW